MSTETITANRYHGNCGRCGAKVPAGTGIYADHAVSHPTEDDCKKTTKTWKRHVDHVRFTTMVQGINAAWEAIGQVDVRPPYGFPSLTGRTQGTPLMRTINRNGQRWQVRFYHRQMTLSNKPNAAVSQALVLDATPDPTPDERIPYVTEVALAEADAAIIAAAIDSWQEAQ